MILGFDAQAEFDMYFRSRLKKVFMPDASERHNPLKRKRVEEEGCGAIADLSDDEQGWLREVVDRKLPPRVEGQLKDTHLATHHIDVCGHTPIEQHFGHRKGVPGCRVGKYESFGSTFRASP